MRSLTDGTTAEEDTPGVYKSPMVFCLCVLGLEFYVYNVVYLSRILPTIDKANLVPAYAIIFNALWLMTFWCWATVHLSDPGTITDEWRDFVKNAQGLDVIVSRQEWQPGKVTTNKKSNDIRPERAHFCSTMKKDVLRMDHFCPWTGNCVGIGNHKHFLLLGIYGALAGLLGLGTALPDLLGCSTGYAENAYIWQSVSAVDRGFFLAFGFFAALTALMLTGLVTAHFPLACQNMTTIEELYTNMPNPYDQQNVYGNLQQTFGAFGWDWFLPVKPRHLKSDGFSYRRNGEVFPDGLVEVYGRDVPANHVYDDIELVLHRLPGDIWHFRYTGQTRGEKQEKEKAASSSWFAWLSGA